MKHIVYLFYILQFPKPNIVIQVSRTRRTLNDRIGSMNETNIVVSALELCYIHAGPPAYNYYY